MKQRIIKRESIRKKEDFKKDLQEGIWLKSKFYNFCFKRNNLNFCRIGIIAKKEIGNAVRRNYERRIVKEFFRQNKTLLDYNVDIIIFIKKNVNKFNKTFFLKKKEDFLEILKKINDILR